jgi:L-fuculose-phosphate aldolase
MIALAGKNVRCAKYATFGTEELELNAYQAMEDRNAVFLANHGLLTGAENIFDAFNIAEEIEFCAEIYYRAKTLGNPILLSDSEMELVMNKFKTYGHVEDDID